jgi:hypothetical protein
MFRRVAGCGNGSPLHQNAPTLHPIWMGKGRSVTYYAATVPADGHSMAKLHGHAALRVMPIGFHSMYTRKGNKSVGTNMARHLFTPHTEALGGTVHITPSADTHVDGVPNQSAMLPTLTSCFTDDWLVIIQFPHARPFCHQHPSEPLQNLRQRIDQPELCAHCQESSPRYPCRQ